MLLLQTDWSALSCDQYVLYYDWLEVSMHSSTVYALKVVLLHTVPRGCRIFNLAH